MHILKAGGDFMFPCHNVGSLALLALGLGILIGSACGSTFLTILLALACIGLGCMTMRRKR